VAKTYKDATEKGVLEGADFMNMAVVPSSYSKPLYFDYGGAPQKGVKSPPRPGTREPEMDEDQTIAMLHQKLGPNFAAAMSVPMSQWGGEWKKMPKKMKQRIKAVQRIFHEMKEEGLTTTDLADKDTGDIVL
tara:strand:+ start:154 stop:549 length:396 start_codon:yes stop_codon:yes gene_type:complete